MSCRLSEPNSILIEQQQQKNNLEMRIDCRGEQGNLDEMEEP